MPLPAALPLIISGASALGGMVSNIVQAKKQRKAQEKMASTAHQRDVEMWNQANAYNAPEAQMQRLQKAGLNPNLAYGSGSVAGNTSTSTPKYQSYATPVASIQMPEVMSMLSQYQALRGQKLKNEEQSTINSYLSTKLEQEQQGRYIKGQKGYYDIGIGDSKVSSSPYSRKYQSEIQGKDFDNAIKQIMLKSFQTYPPWLRSALPMLMGMFK